MAKAKLGPLTVNESTGDFDIIAIFDYNAIADNATSANQVTIGQVPAGGGVAYVVVHEATALAGASDITLDVGTTAGDPDEFINALDVDAMTVPVYNTGDLFEAANAEGVALVGFTATAADILVEWNGTVASLTAGKVVIGVKLVNPARFL